MKQHEYEPQRQENPYHPFSGRDEWELGKFLCDNFTQSQINTFLKLDWVCANASLHVIRETLFVG